MNENSNKVEGQWIVIASAKDMKKGATKYSTPVFEIGEHFSSDEMSKADDAYKVIASYYDGYIGKDEPTPEPEEDSEELVF
jgi:hypothetical protein